MWQKTARPRALCAASENCLQRKTDRAYAGLYFANSRTALAVQMATGNTAYYMP
jgi:hypothetical protein